MRWMISCRNGELIKRDRFGGRYPSLLNGVARVLSAGKSQLSRGEKPAIFQTALLGSTAIDEGRHRSFGHLLLIFKTGRRELCECDSEPWWPLLERLGLLLANDRFPDDVRSDKADRLGREGAGRGGEESAL